MFNVIISVVLLIATLSLFDVLTKEVDEKAQLMIDLNSCQHTMKSQDKLLREIYVKDAIEGK